MKEKKLILFNFLTLLTISSFFMLMISCNSAPQTVADTEVKAPDAVAAPPPPPEPEIAETAAHETIVELVSELVVITEAYYVSTREEVQLFIGNLNEIINNRDFNAWEASLTPEYIAAVTSPVNLRHISDMALMRRYNIVLKDLKDYFNYVVIPARSAERIHTDNVDIEFINEHRVTAFTTRVNNTGEQVSEILYDLEKIGNSWKIIY